MLKILKIHPPSANFQQIEFSWLGQEADKLAANGALEIEINSQKLTLVTLFFSPKAKTGQFLVYSGPLFEENCLYPATIAQPLINLPVDMQQNIVILGKQNGIAAALFAAKYLKIYKPLIILEFDNVIPFSIQPSHIVVKHLPAHVIAAATLLEDWHVASRIATHIELPGCFCGSAQDLLQIYLQQAQIVTPVVYDFT